MFLSPENFQETLKEPKAAQETPYELQYQTKKTTKKKEFKCLRGKKCLKLAISFSTILKPNFGIQNCIFFLDFYWNCWKPFKWKLKLMLKPGLESERDPRGPRWPQKCHHELQSTKNLHVQKPLKTSVFSTFLATEASQKSLKRPKKAPKRHPKNPKSQKIGIQNWAQKL